jgi:hypothetical protein
VRLHRGSSPPPRSCCYRPNGTVNFHIQDGHLFNNSAWMIPAGELRFVHRVWSDLEFQRDESGKVVSLRYDDFVGVKTR